MSVPTSTFDLPDVRETGDVEPGRPVQFERFSWIPWVSPGTPLGAARMDQLLRCVERAHDVAAGVADVLAIVEGDAIASDSCTDGAPRPTVLPAVMRGNLTRLSIVTLELFAQSSSRLFDAVNSDHPATSTKERT